MPAAQPMQRPIGNTHLRLKMGRLNFTVNYSAPHEPIRERDPVSIGLKVLAVLVLAGGLTAVGFMMNDSDAIAYLQTFAIR
jgi:hypothetical protein